MEKVKQNKELKYKVVYCNERSELDRQCYGDDCWMLVEVATDQVVFSDLMEIEDATLVRDLSVLVDLLNEK